MRPRKIALEFDDQVAVEGIDRAAPDQASLGEMHAVFSAESKLRPEARRLKTVRRKDQEEFTLLRLVPGARESGEKVGEGLVAHWAILGMRRGGMGNVRHPQCPPASIEGGGRVPPLPCWR